ncbi:MarR family winged helix-turn-helix transcriptional regulator [Phyllobacterium leguminum]|uniref:DNA-binding MarR family transcriptional regulator n=1 Tax=Phyllobacterium leguminum TaxID=314237 RepID=A0A318SYD9_9HYPH|nr:MarR family transcriptional regulator [Phyllobacterium leguminum]PYE86951.1 DNA-binding MarR family transcriptional regulator [Phyllobacterium leguminum]
MFDDCIYFNTQALGRQLERVWTRAFKPFDLTPPQGFMLRAILDKPGRLQSELADELKIARATATRALDGLEARGLVERLPTKRDGRECEIQPTPKAQEIKDELNKASGEITKSLKAQLGASEFASFVGQVKAISDKIR